MFVLCKKEVIDSENGNKVSYSAGKNMKQKLLQMKIYSQKTILVNSH